MSTHNDEQNLFGPDEWLRFDLDKLQASDNPVHQKFYADYMRQVELTAIFRCPYCRHCEVHDEQGNIATSLQEGVAYSITCDSPDKMLLDIIDFKGNTPPICLGFNPR